MVRGLDEAEFCLAIAGKAVARADAAYIAGCLFRALELCAHALHGHAGRWLINEKGAIAAAGRIPGAPAHFAMRAPRLLGRIGSSPAELAASIGDGQRLVEETAAACAPG